MWIAYPNTGQKGGLERVTNGAIRVTPTCTDYMRGRQIPGTFCSYDRAFTLILSLRLILELDILCIALQ